MKPGLICSSVILCLILTLPVYSSNLLIIGDQEDGGQLYIPIQVEEGPDGNLYVMDAKDAFIKVYSSTGNFLRKMGGRGQGPGEMVRLGTFSFAGKDSLLFTEMINGHRWITFMKLSGKVDRVVKIDLTGQFGVRHAEMLPNGSIAAEIHFWGKALERGNHLGLTYERRLVVLDKNGKVEREIIKLNQVFSVSYNPKGADIRVPFFPDFLWTMEKEGSVIFSQGNSNEFQYYNAAGKETRKIVTALPEPPNVTDQDLDQWRKKVKTKIVKQRGNEQYQKYFSMIEKYNDSIYKKQPVYSGLTRTPAGNLLVKGAKDESGKRTYWLLDKNGQLVNKIESKATSVTIGSRFVSCTRENEEDEILVYCSLRKGNEIDDLNALLKE